MVLRIGPESTLRVGKDILSRDGALGFRGQGGSGMSRGGGEFSGRGLAVGWWVLVAAVCLAACSRAPEPPPYGLAGARLGDPPGPGLTVLPVPLPSDLAGRLVYRARPGPAGVFHGRALADPVFAFLGDRLLSVAAFLVDPAGEPSLARELEAAYGPPLARDGAARLWRLDGVDVVLDRPEPDRVRLLVRSRSLARELADWRGQEAPLERDAGE